MVIAGKPFTLPGFTSPALALRHARFVQAIVHRYSTRSCQRQRRVSLVLARRWTSQTVLQRHWHRWTSLLMPRIDLHVRNERVAALLEKAETPGVRRTVETVVEYVHARSQRVESTPDAALVQGRAPQMLVVRRAVTAPTVAREDYDSAATPVSAAARQNVHSRLRNTVPATAPAIDVERLTEQVINGIDRRIIAQRERLGRF